MKRKLFLLFTSFACLAIGKPQGIGSFLSQQATELKYYQTQIAYFELDIGYLEKGYRIAREGLAAITGIKKGDFNLHQAFFSSLASVNPTIGRYSRVADIIALQLSIISNFKSALQQTGIFSKTEMAYLQSVYSNLCVESSKALTELIELLTDGRMTMTDDQRIRRMDQIDADMRDKYAFSQSFSSESKVEAAQRLLEENEIDFLETLY